MLSNIVLLNRNSTRCCVARHGEAMERGNERMIYLMNLFSIKGACIGACSRKRNVMKRYHQELARTKRVHRQHLRDLHQWPRQAIDCVCEFQVGRFRKQKALGCGKSHCLLCHFEKLFGFQSVKDRIRQQRFLDSLNDHNDSSLSDDELILIAEDTFLELDRRETEDARSDEKNPIDQY